MKVVFNKENARRTLRWLQRGLYITAVLGVGFYAWFRVDGIYHQQRLRAQFDQRRATVASTPLASPTRPLSEPPLPANATVPAEAVSKTPRISENAGEGLVARLTVPRLNLDVMVLAGDDERSLRLGAGHIRGTALPEERGNMGIAAHRDTFFRPLRSIRKNDLVHLSTASARKTYQVDWIAVVEPNHVSVLDPTPDSSLTLVTCFPFDYVGRSPKRYIVRARELSETAVGQTASPFAVE